MGEILLTPLSDLVSVANINSGSNLTIDNYGSISVAKGGAHQTRVFSGIKSMRLYSNLYCGFNIIVDGVRITLNNGFMIASTYNGTYSFPVYEIPCKDSISIEVWNTLGSTTTNTSPATCQYVTLK